MKNNIKDEYMVMCFPCLKRKPDLSEFEPTADFSDQFEYIVEKYTIRKVPLLLANTAEDIIERQQELEMTKVPQNQPQLIKDDFVNFQVAHEVYNVQKVPPCITVAAHSVCPGRKDIKERPKPSDILESMSPIPRPPVKNHNYVVIPTKGSLRSKDIMMTKREITNQYLNNFSSVFVDNLKDQVPKDPERFPNLSRPYTSALRNYPLTDTKARSTDSKKSKRGRSQKVAYAFPLEDTIERDETSIKEEPYYDSDSVMEQTTDVPESEFPEDTVDLTEKSLVLLNDTDSGGGKDGIECVPNPFKTTIKSSMSEIEHNTKCTLESTFHTHSFFSHKEDWPSFKNVTYEDIQALDVGYEFKSCEKLGVKPKMTRIHYPHETDRLKDSLKQLALGDSKLSKKSFSGQDQTLDNLTLKSNRGCAVKSKQVMRSPEAGLKLFSETFITPLQKRSSKSVIAETSFLSKGESNRIESLGTPSYKYEDREVTSTTTLTSKSEESKSQSFQDLEENTPSAIDGSVAEISKLYELTLPATQGRAVNVEHVQSKKEEEEPTLRFPMPSKSRSFHETGRSGGRKENEIEVKGKLPYPNPNSSTKKTLSRLDEPETETTCSLYSPESKTSSLVTSPRSSEPDEGKRATLRWKIVIKHHREDDSLRKNVNVNLKN